MKHFKIITLGIIAVGSMHLSASEDTSLVNNYADDAVVQIQSVASEIKPTPEEHLAVVPAVTQAPHPDEPTHHEEPKTLSLQDMQTLVASPTPQTIPVAHEAVVAKPVVKTEEAAPTTPAVTHTQASTSKAPVATPATHAQESVTPPATTPHEIMTMSITTPAIAQPVAPADNVKIVKVYPVYDAVRSAVKSVNAAAHDMISYVYNFMTTPKTPHTPAPKEVVATQKTEVLTEKVIPQA